jgi:sulfate adenylyltransferase subunit 1 (EFTu-like GTPase family)
VTHDGKLSAATASQSVTVLLQDELDISRGDLLAHPHAMPQVARSLEADLCWMDVEALDRGRTYLFKHTTRVVRGAFGDVLHKIDIETLLPGTASQSLTLNDIGRVRVVLQQPLVFDRYRENRGTGSFIVIDEVTHHTVAAGMIV